MTLLFLAGCCTKKKCSGQDPFIAITLTSFTIDELLQTTLDTYEVGSNSLVGSCSACVSVKNNEGLITIGSPDSNKEMREFYFVIKNPARTDTIYDINYELFNQVIKCNSCFLFISQKEKIKSYGNFSFCHKGTQYFSETLTINK
jgi:hypothetical protein